MSRIYLLAALAAMLIPVLLPHHAVPPRTTADARAVTAAPPPPTPAPRAVKPPQSLEEALWRVSDMAAGGLSDEARCLAQAVYFEARSEPLEGQLAVAQVVLNRVRSPYWPDRVCAVVFEGEQRRHHCQFSFACDGRSDNPKNRRAWRRAKMVALVALDGLWRDVSGHATHYHATYVTPAWRTAMAPTVRYGHHVFYRDRRVAAFADARSDGASLGVGGS